MKRSSRSGRGLGLFLHYFLQGLLLPALFLCFLSCTQPTHHGENKQTEIKKEIYYCPMHPDVQQDHPGICPKLECKGMELIKKEPEDILNMVLQAANSSVLSNIKTIHPEKKEITITIETQGYIDYDDRTKHNIASRFDGRMDKLYVKYNYQPVRRGEKIFDIYSPELVTAQENLLFLLNTDKDATDLIEAAKQKLKILGMSDEQIKQLVVGHKAQNSVSVYSKWDGHIHEMRNFAQNDNSNPVQGMSMETNNNTPNTSQTGYSSATTPSLSVKEGMYVTKGQTIFNVVDPHNVVVMLQIKAQDIAKVKMNQKVNLEIDETPKMVMEGKVNFIEPVLKTGYKTLFVRVDLVNSEHKHKVGTLIKGVIENATVEGLWIPASALVDLGKNKIVWVKKEGHFIARKIETGVFTKEWVEVTDGISSRDEIAIEGHYLTDSEGFIKITEE